MLGALAQGIGPTDIEKRLAIWGNGRLANVETRSILATLLLLAILVSSTVWQAFATQAYFSPSLAIIVALAPWLPWRGVKMSTNQIFFYHHKVFY